MENMAISERNYYGGPPYDPTAEQALRNTSNRDHPSRGTEVADRIKALNVLRRDRRISFEEFKLQREALLKQKS